MTGSTLHTPGPWRISDTPYDAIVSDYPTGEGGALRWAEDPVTLICGDPLVGDSPAAMEKGLGIR